MKDYKKYIEDLKKWLEERKRDQHYSLEQFDKLIIYISSGALIVTIGFVRDIVRITENTDTFLLKTCWYLLTLALIINLLSQISCYFSNKFEIYYTNKEINDLEDQGSFDKKKPEVRKIKFFMRFFNVGTIILNVVSFISMITGIILFVVFINQNI
ncbi:MAG: hypothetical protein JXB17_08415 [Bacteroidales bacterium]|nr:hypothetical protein [Bacteroidales bacterium]